MNQRHQRVRTGKRLWTTVAVSALTCLGLAAAPLAQADTVPSGTTPATVSADVLPTWQINGVVWSSVLVNNTVYVTGSFTKARPPGVSAGGSGEVDALNIFAFDVTTGNRVTTFNHSLNAQGRTITASSDGSRVYVGGDFTAVDGQARSHLAAFSTATGALDTTFTAGVDYKVAALAASGSTLYVGGNFSVVTSGTTRASRKSLAAVGAYDGKILPWAPTADNGSVTAMVKAPLVNRVIVGGRFTTLNGQSAYGMGSVDGTTGTVQQWDANKTIRDATSSGAITSLRTDGRQVYGSGYAYGAGSSFEGTFAADPSTGRLTLVNDCHGDTYDVLPVGPVLYSVGHAHDCQWIGSFPDTSPRVRWQRALAQTITPTTTNRGPDNYGWNYNGLPASTVLHWFPDLASGSYTGQNQGPWALTGNANYVVMGGEFPTVNGVRQQGLVRMAVKTLAPNRRGPTYTTKPATPVPATTATSPTQGTVRVTFGAAWDHDNETLTYELLRDGGTTPVASVQMKSNFWTLPQGTLTDINLTRGSTHTYRVRIKDPFGNVLMSPTSNTVTTS